MDFIRASMTDSELAEEQRQNRIAEKVVELLKPRPARALSESDLRWIEYGKRLEAARQRRNKSRYSYIK